VIPCLEDQLAASKKYFLKISRFQSLYMSRGAIASRTLRPKNSKGDPTPVLNKPLRFLGRSLTVALCSTCLMGHALAQGNTADPQGVITDPSGGTVSGARVRLENPAVGLVRETTSRETGEYSFLSLPPARYAIRVDARGFRSAVVSDLLLTVGQKAQVPIQLEISPLVEALNILVSGTEVETTRSSLATTIDQRAIENLPINGRSYIQFTLLDSATTRDNQPILAPAPTSGLNINGQRARANFVTINGVDATDASVNGVRATLSQEAVQEFQILKSGYAPEYGRASSAVINIVSKQGTNQWRGNLFGYLRSRKVSATNAFADEPDPGDTRTQAGATLGGPIKKEKTFAFLSIETTQANSINFSAIGRDNFGFTPSRCWRRTPIGIE
jgi:hypothetical protein